MIVGNTHTKHYKKYIFAKKGSYRTFDSLKREYRLQIVIEGERAEKVYFSNNKILVVQITESGIHYKEYKKTKHTYRALSLQKLAYTLHLQTYQVTEEVLYNENELYYLH